MEYKGFTYTPSPKTAWDNLSMLEKSEMMKVAVRNGITDLKTIRDEYNEFAEGGRKRRQESINNAATQQAMQYFINKGLAQHQAAGLVGNLFRESRLNPTATNASSGAYGIAQWLGDRKKNLFAKYGKNPTLNQQLDYVWHELNNTHTNGLKKLKASRDSTEAARNAMGFYEFMAGPDAAIREMRKYGQNGERSMQEGIDFASQLSGQPVVPYKAETSQWDNIPFTPVNPEAFFSNSVAISQPVVDMELTRTPILEYDQKEAERQEKRDNLNRFNMFLSMLNGSNESAFPFSMFAEGGKIHISPSKKGTFTAAASRHNMGVQEFASKVLANKDDYSSAMVRKANFARNARHWKHGLGGNLFDDGGDKDNIFKYTNSNGDIRYVYQDNPDSEEVPVRPLNTIFPDPAQWTFIDDAGKFYTPRRTTPTNTAELNPDNRTGFERALDNYIGEAFNTVPKGYHTLPAIAAGAFGLANPAIGEAALTSAFGAHGISRWVNGEVNGPLDAATTALEILPLGRLAKPIANETINAGKLAYNELYIPWKISSTMNRSLDSNPIIRTYASNPKYKDIGTLLDYQDYIQSIFPNSTIRNVVYHTTYSKPFEQFDPNKIKRGFGFYFSPSEHSLPFGRNVYAKVNIKNPLEINKNTNPTLSVDGLSGFGTGASKRVLATRNALNSGKYDGIIGITNMRNPGEPEIVALDPNQIHILGSSRDLVGFKRKAFKPKVRTRVGDVEIDNPNLLYHLDRGDSAGAFSNQGAYVEDGKLLPGIAKEGEIPYSWWNLGRPYATGVNGQPMTRLMTTTKDTPGMLHVRSQNYSIGQWNGKRGLVTNAEYVNPEGVNVSESTYTLDPNYGWRRLFAEDASTAKWADVVKTPQITADNVASITPEQWTAAQDAAIARGDIAEAQRLRDLHFKVYAPDTKQATPMYNASGESTFNEFNGGETGLNWFSESEKYAANHGVPRAFYINEPDIYFGNVPAWIKGTPADERYIQSLRKLGYTEKQIAQKVQEINEAANSTAPAAKSVGMGSNNELVTRNNNTIKLADAVTYDDNGVRIPLGLRDNFKINDIRYGLLPFLGLGAAGTLYGKQE